MPESNLDESAPTTASFQTDSLGLELIWGDDRSEAEHVFVDWDYICRDIQALFCIPHDR